MKRFKKTAVWLVLICMLAFVTACNTPVTDGDATAAYKTEYYLEGDNGYALDASKGETLSGEVGSTVTIEKKTIDGYYFDSEHESNLLRGQVLADGSLVLKAYYAKDYTGSVTFESIEGDSIDMLKGTKKNLDVTVKVNGEAVNRGVSYSSSYRVITIDSKGEMEAKMRGESDITVTYGNVSKTYRVTAYDKFIETEADWWSVYDHLGYWYKFKNDIVLTESTDQHFTVLDEAGNITTPGYTVNHTFEGVIDGGGHSLTYQFTRLFNWVSGDKTVIRNITFHASQGFYWGSAISYGIDNKATIENVTMNAEFIHADCFRYVTDGLWIQCGGDDGVKGNGGMFATMDNCTVTDCTVNLTISAIQNTAPFGGVAYSAVNSVIKNCTINSTDDTISVIAKADTAGSTITDCEVNLLEQEEPEPEQILIESEEDYWAIYASAETLNGRYKFANDITLTRSSCEGEEYKTNYVFTGEIDGNGKKLTNVSQRLFYGVKGTIRNLTVDAGKGFYWGSAIAFTTFPGAALKNLTVNAEFDSNETYQYADGNTLSSNGSGGLVVWLTGATVEDCTINITLSGTATAAYHAGIAYDVTDSTMKNVTVNCAAQLEPYKSGTPVLSENVVCNAATPA